LALLVPSQAGAQQQKEWTWTDASGHARTRAELDKVFAEHILWLKSGESRGTRADLSSAHLTYADLVGAELNSADLIGARLVGADLTNADLVGADLVGADLMGAHLNGTSLNDADLTDAHLSDGDLTDAHLARADLSQAYMNTANLTRAVLDSANLSGAHLLSTNLTRASLNRADLTRASLNRADLTRVELVGAELKDAHFSDADLQDATFEPNSTPELRSIATARHLELVTYQTNPDALAQLRKQFQENGFRTQERKITYALSRRKAELDGPVERWFQRMAFDLTCQYGMNPGRALQIWLALLLFCWLAYAVFIHVPGESGIYRLQKTGGPTAKEEIEEQIRPRTIPSRPLWRYPVRFIHQELRVFFWAGFFSLMSAFNIGFRDINFGRWLRLLPRTEYDLKAKGWARTVAGFQSLISVYLIALWVLTYFGRPFE